MADTTSEFPMCGHPEQPWLGAPVRTIGTCPVHDYICPRCGFGVGQQPACRCALLEARRAIEVSGMSLKTVEELEAEIRELRG